VGFQLVPIGLLSPLGHLVGYVVGGGAEEQVPFGVSLGWFGLAAGRVVTVVQNVEAGRYRAVDESPCNAVGIDCFACELNVSVPAVTILGTVRGSGPLKAPVGHPLQSSRETLSGR